MRRLALLHSLFLLFPSNLIAEEPAPSEAIALMQPTQGNNASGIVTFKKSDAGLQIDFNINGLAPGLHAVHIHQFGNCSAPDGLSAGEHFQGPNHTHMTHGAPTDTMRHAGDLGNIEADSDGKVTVTIIDRELSLSGGKSIIGRAMVVHSEPDDLKSQPAGKSGSRVTCGVIGIAK